MFGGPELRLMCGAVTYRNPASDSPERQYTAGRVGVHVVIVILYC